MMARSHFPSRPLSIAAWVMLAASIAPFLTQTAIAADESCYLITASGKRVGLGQLCGADPQQPTQIRQKSTPSDGVFRARIKRRIAATPVIEVTFNNQQSFEMIVDTGASGSLITRNMAQALQIRPVGVMNAGIADGRVVQFPVGVVRSMAVNGLITQNMQVAIAPQMEIGLLGHDFFGNYDLKIKRDVVEFYPR
jgi:predicted aspartyl protease